MNIEEIETKSEGELVATEFDDVCDICKSPKGKTFMVGYSNTDCGQECDYYICQKCAEKKLNQ